jgi:hypothetical protein
VQGEPKLRDAELEAAEVGDAVVRMGWDSDAMRPTMTLVPPEALFFAVGDGDFADDVVLAWDERGSDGELVLIVHRYRIEPRFVADDETPALATDERIATGGGLRWVERRYPWAPDVWTWRRCVLHMDVWPHTALAGRSVLDLPVIGAGVDLRIDFVPVVHMPWDSVHGFGSSLITHVSQLLDDLAAGDTDSARAAELTAGPMIAVSGTTASAASIKVHAGSVVTVPDPAGSLTSLDLTANLTAHRAYVAELVDRLLVTAGVSAESIGMVTSADTQSGVTMVAARAPDIALNEQLRLVRAFKWRLILRMAQRLAQAGGVLEPGPTPDAWIEPGPFLPSDRGQAVAEALQLFEAGLVSRGTAIRMLRAAGLGLHPAEEQLARRDDFTGAGELADATADDTAARRYLGLGDASPGVVASE